MSGIVVTGLGAISALGRGAGALLAGLEAGRSGIGPIARFDTGALRVHTGASVSAEVLGEQGAPGSSQGGRRMRCVRLALVAAEEAIAAVEGAGAGALGGVPPERVAVIMGTSLGDGREPVSTIASEVARAVGARGPAITISTACASSTNAVGLGRDLLAYGEADLVLAGGADELGIEVFAGFHALGLLHPERCTPFAGLPGTSLGEGAGLLVLEREGEREGARPIARLLGYGLSADAFHETSPDPRGRGVARALRWALADAGLAPEQVAYLNVHGTGTAANDDSEARAVEAVFGPAMRLSSTKSHLGHAQGAAGVLEAIACLLAQREGRLVPTLWLPEEEAPPRPRAPEGHLRGARLVEGEAGTWVCTNSAFGGANASIVLAPPASPSPAASHAPRPIRVAGWAAIGSASADPGEVAAALASPPPLREVARGADPRGLDPSAIFAITAAALALSEAGHRVKGGARDRSGLVLGSTRVSPASGEAYRESLDRRGPSGVSAAAFARLVLHAPAGSACKELGLRGPTSTLSAEGCAGLLAIVYAARLLAQCPDLERMLGVGLDEAEEPTSGAAREAEGAAAVVLAPADPEREGPLLLGARIEGPGRLTEAALGALREAALGPEQLDLALGDPLEGPFAALPRRPLALRGAPSLRGALAFVEAARTLRRGAAASVLVAIGDPQASVAVALGTARIPTP